MGVPSSSQPPGCMGGGAGGGHAVLGASPRATRPLEAHCAPGLRPLSRSQAPSRVQSVQVDRPEFEPLSLLSGAV